jgi:hypothetical protein
MSDEYNVFISWSGPRSKWIAEFFHGWLPLLVQSAKPWMSATDIEKGTRGLNEISNTLRTTKVAIVCLTPENLNAPWILYEAGASSKTIDEKTRLCTYLLGGLEFQQVTGPLGMFQATNPTKEDTRALVRTINAAVSDSPVPVSNLDLLFERMWPDLEQKLATIPESEQPVAPKRLVDDMVTELLEISRAQFNNTISMQSKLSNLENIFSREQSGHWPISLVGAPDVLSGRVQPLSSLMVAGQKVVNPFVFESIPTFVHLNSTPVATEPAAVKKPAAAKLHAGEAAPSKSGAEPGEKSRK